MTDDQLVYAARNAVHHYKTLSELGSSAELNKDEIARLRLLDFDYLHSLAGAVPHEAYDYIRNSVEYLISLEEWAEEIS